MDSVAVSDRDKKIIIWNFIEELWANMILEQVTDKPKKINYERIIKEIVAHVMTFCIGYKAALIKP
jgi:hypothetical protein